MERSTRRDFPHNFEAWSAEMNRTSITRNVSNQGMQKSRPLWNIYDFKLQLMLTDFHTDKERIRGTLGIQ